MLTAKENKEIREHLERAQNPVFFFDNDPDGLCSFLILRRRLGRGTGVPVRSFPAMNAEYFRKAMELNADYIFILDKPVVSDEFFEEARKFNLPVVWIDHHQNDSEIPEFVNYYNPLKHGTNEPVTYLCYRLFDDEKSLWLAVIGCISDRFFPEFYGEFLEMYPDLVIDSEDAFDILYNSQIGKIIRMFGFILKDKTSSVSRALRFLVEVKTPYEVLEESDSNKNIHRHCNFLFKKYHKFLDKAKSIASESKLLFFQYGGDTSMSADLSNQLSFLYPEKVVVVAYNSGIRANLSVRGKKIRDAVLKSLEGLEDAGGGGHEDAVGARVRIEDIETFRERLEKEIC